MNKKCFISIAIVLVLGSGVTAREITLNETIGLAKSHSYQLKAAKAQSDAFEEGLRSATAERLPSLSLAATASYKDESPEAQIDLPGSSFNINFSPKENYQTDLRLSLPLFTGGKIGGSIKLASATRDYYRALERATEDEIVFAARVEYLSLYRADQLVEVARAGLKRARLIERNVQSLYDAGAADSVDILDARKAVTDAAFDVQSAQTARRQGEIRIAVLLGLDPDEQISIADKIPAPPVDEPIPLNIAPTKPELLAANSSISMSQSLVALNKADYFPSLSVFGGYSWGKPNIDPFNDEFNDFFVIGANLSWSLNLGGKSTKNVSKARHQLNAARHQYDRTHEQLNRQARITLESLKLTRARYQTALEISRIATDNYRLAGEKHRQGVLSASRLLEIEAALTAAEASLASAQADFYIVQSQYYFATGSKKIEEGI